MALQHYYIFASHTEIELSFTWHILFNLFYWWCWLLFYPVLKYLTKKIVIKNKFFYWVLFYFLFPVFIISLHQVLASAVITYALNYKGIWELTLNRILASQWVWVDIVIYFIMTTGLNLFELQDKERLITIRNSQLQTQLYNSQFDVLNSQIQPHFLFNTLNTLSTLIYKQDDKEAQRMLNLLDSFLKTTVYENTRNNITLKEEMVFISNYLEIERVRFKDKLEIVQNIDPDTFYASVPNFILQPIVENAIHHAIVPLKKNGIIRISSGIESLQLYITVEDNGPGLSSFQKQSGKGLGLKITRERLLHSYPEQSSLNFAGSELGGLKITIKIPFNSVLENELQTV